MMMTMVRSEVAVEAEAAVEVPVEPEEVLVLKVNAPKEASSSKLRTISLPYDLPNEILKAVIT